MSDKKQQPSVSPKTAADRAEREARLARALRDNLKRRKGAGRAQPESADAAETGEKEG